MSSLTLNRLAVLPTSATAYVTGLFRKTNIKDIPMNTHDDDHHVHIAVPNKQKAFTSNSMQNLAIRGNSKATTGFFSITKKNN